MNKIHKHLKKISRLFLRETQLVLPQIFVDLCKWRSINIWTKKHKVGSITSCRQTNSKATTNTIEFGWRWEGSRFKYSKMNYKLSNKTQRNFCKESSQEMEEILKFKCGWLSLTSIISRENVKYMREDTYN